MSAAFAFSSVLFAQSSLPANALPANALPANALIVERVPVPEAIHKNRELILWMIAPQKHDRGHDSAAHPYSCPETTLGSYYSGPTRFSVADTATGQLISTEKIQHPGRGPDTFNLPYRILPGLYSVPGVAKGTEGKPALLTLSDVNGDGLPLEIRFLEAESCSSLQTMLTGYSVRQDRVIRYQLEMKITDYLMLGEDGGNKTVPNGSPESTTAIWVQDFFIKPPTEPGHWQYQQDLREYNYPLLEYNIRYDSVREVFAGTLKSTSPPRGQY